MSNTPFVEHMPTSNKTLFPQLNFLFTNVTSLVSHVIPTHSLVLIVVHGAVMLLRSFPCAFSPIFTETFTDFLIQPPNVLLTVELAVHHHRWFYVTVVPILPHVAAPFCLFLIVRLDWVLFEKLPATLASSNFALAAFYPNHFVL